MFRSAGRLLRVRRLIVIMVGGVVILAILLVTVPLDGEGVVPVKLELSAGVIEARNNLTRSTSTSVGSHSHLAASHIVLVNSSDHRLMRRVARQVGDELEQLAFVDRVSHVEGEQWALVDVPPADVFFVLSMPSHKVSGLVATGRTLEAEVRVVGGRLPWPPRHRQIDRLTPPVVDFGLRGALDHHSVTRGAETAAARHKLAADNIASQLAKSLGETLAGWAGKHGTMPPLPEAFFGRGGQLPEDLPLPESPQPWLHYHGPRLLVHQDAIWTVPADSPAEFVGELHEALEAVDWRTTYRADGGRSSAYLRATRGDEIFEAYQQETRPGLSRSEIEPDHVVIRYQQRFSRRELEQAIETLMSVSQPTPELVLFRDHMSGDQHDRFFEMVQATDAVEPRLLLPLARHLHSRGDAQGARAMLQRAVAMMGLTGHTSRSDVERLGGTITGDDDWSAPAPDPADLRAAGFHELRPDGRLEVEAALGHPVLVNVPGEKRDDRFAVLVEPSTIPEGVFTLRLKQENGASSSTVHHPPRPWTHRTHVSSGAGLVSVEASELTPERFQVKIELRPGN